MRIGSRRRGGVVARLLAGAWRAGAGPPELSAVELREIAPLLLRCGAAGLAWRRIRTTPWSESRVARRLHKAYRLQVLHAGLHERNLRRTLEVLGSLGIEALLVKGWAVARWYPDPALRPYGDIDLCLRPEDFRAAQGALAKAVGGVVDLHPGVPLLGERPLREVWQRSVQLAGDGFVVRTPSREDHVRYLCLHGVSHGICRPLWLCDLGAALECPPDDLDWDLLLRGREHATRWVGCALGLARDLLDARLMGAPPSVREARLPRWLVPSVLREWGRPRVAPGNRTPMAFYLRRPAGALAALRTRWPSAVEASFGVGAPVDGLPRLPFQVAECMSRALRFARRVPALLRARELTLPAGGG